MSLAKKMLAAGVLVGALDLGNHYAAEKPNLEKKVAEKEDTKEKETQDYFPLQEGNSWTYETVIPEGETHYQWREYIGKNGLAIQGTPSGKYITKFDLVKTTGKWHKLNIEKDEMDSFEGSGRVYIKTRPHLGDQELNWIIETPDDAEPFSKRAGFRHCSLKFYECKRTNPVGDHSKPQPLMYAFNPDFKKEYDITVPAGKFKCTRVIERYIPKNSLSASMREQVSGIQAYEGWNVEIYLAKNVGPVLKRQFDNKGKVFSTESLIAYKIGGQNDSKK